jgi:molybdopterin-guanine dinucleotide biosynthesis protein A
MEYDYQVYLPLLGTPDHWCLIVQCDSPKATAATVETLLACDYKHSHPELLIRVVPKPLT